MFTKSTDKNRQKLFFCAIEFRFILSDLIFFHQNFYQLSTVTFPDYLEMVDITDLNDTRLRKKVAPPKYLGAKIESNLGELRASKLDSLSMKCKLSGLKKGF